MAKGSAHPVPLETSYELYKELVEELMAPIETSMDAHVRYELYLSKLVYLENLLEQCFRTVNGSKSATMNGIEHSFTADDLNTIRRAITSTHSHLRETILEALEQQLSQIGLRNVGI
ncbi:MAG: hypothetical protein FJY29_08935 [Betaproteobacteria bacterium]|nr:hypothetical protein [Betaproteobacteria bacterium]